MKEEFKTYKQQFGECWENGKLIGYKGKITPKTAQEIIEDSIK